MTAWLLTNVQQPPTKKMILWTLGDLANHDGSGAWPSNDTMAECVCVDRRTIQRNLRELERDGYIVDEGKSPAGTTCWRVVVPWYEDPESGDGNLPPAENEGAASDPDGGGTVPPEPVPDPAHKVSTDVETPVQQQLLDGEQPPPGAFTADLVKQVFDYWREVMGKTGNVVLNAKRRDAIKQRLREGYTVEDLKLAVDGCKNTPHNMGQNDRGRPFNDIELICRNGPNVERFRDAAGAPSSVKRDRHRLGQTSTIDDDAVFEKSRAALNGR